MILGARRIFFKINYFWGTFFLIISTTDQEKKREYQDCAVQPPIFPAELWVLDTDFYIDKQ